MSIPTFGMQNSQWSFLFQLPFPSKLPDILMWENFLKFRPMVHCGANFRRRQYRPGCPSLPMTNFPLRGRIRLNQLLNNVRVNRNTKFKRLELLPLESVFQIQSNNPTSPTDNGHCSTPPPPRHLHGHGVNRFLNLWAISGNHCQLLIMT